MANIGGPVHLSSYFGHVKGSMEELPGALPDQPELRKRRYSLNSARYNVNSSGAWRLVSKESLDNSSIESLDSDSESEWDEVLTHKHEVTSVRWQLMGVNGFGIFNNECARWLPITGRHIYLCRVQKWFFEVGWPLVCCERWCVSRHWCHLDFGTRGYRIRYCGQGASHFRTLDYFLYVFDLRCGVSRFIADSCLGVFGGRPGMVSGATGAVAVVQGKLLTVLIHRSIDLTLDRRWMAMSIIYTLLCWRWELYKLYLGRWGYLSSWTSYLGLLC